MTRSRNNLARDQIADHPRLCSGPVALSGQMVGISPQSEWLDPVRGNPNGKAGESYRVGGFDTEIGTSTAFVVGDHKGQTVCRMLNSGLGELQKGVVASSGVKNEGRATSVSENTFLSGVGTVTSVIGEGVGLTAAANGDGVRAGGAHGTTFMRCRVRGQVDGRIARSAAFSGPVPHLSNGNRARIAGAFA